MLKIYPIPEDVDKFCQKIYSQERNQNVKVDSYSYDYDFLLLNKEKYAVGDLNEYIDFFQTKDSHQEAKKIAIIANFDKIDQKMQNKLLKTFEDQDNLQILLANKHAQILPTILSRAMIVDLKVSPNEFTKYPTRYWELLNIINSELAKEELVEEEIIIEKIIKFYEQIKTNQYQQAYLIYTLKLSDLSSEIIYETILAAEAQKVENQGNLEELLKLQMYLKSNSNDKFSLENYLIQKIEE